MRREPRRPFIAAATLGPVAIAILVGAALRFYRLGANSFWIDEFATLSLATQAPGEILRTSSTANFIPPLYFLLVHTVWQILGESEVALRLPSVIAGICTIPIVWALTQNITRSRSTADITAALLAVNPLHLWYSQEARPYALLLFFGCSALLAFERAVHTKSGRDWGGFWLCSTLAILTHTTGVIFVAIAWAWGFWAAERQRVLRPLLTLSLAIGVTCAPFFLRIARVLEETGGTFHSPPRAITGLEVGYSLLSYVTGYSFGPAPREIQNFGGLAALRAHPLESTVAVAALLGLLAVSVAKRRATMRPFTALLGISLGTIFFLAAFSGKAYNVRYTLPALVGFLGIVSVAIAALAPRSRALCLTALVGLALWADAQWFWVPRYWKEDSRAAVGWLRSQLGPGARIAVAPVYYDKLLQYYSRKSGAELHFLPVLPESGFTTGASIDALVLTRLHHVPSWRELKAGFLALHDCQVVEGHVSGYQMLVRPMTPSKSSYRNFPKPGGPLSNCGINSLVASVFQPTMSTVQVCRIHQGCPGKPLLIGGPDWK